MIENTVSEKKCLWCGNHEFQAVATRKDNASIVRCLHCGLVQLENKPEDLTSIYNQDDYFKKAGNNGDKPPLVGYANYDEMPLNAFIWQYSFLKLFTQNSGKRLLDIGCASGKFLELAEMAGFSVTGIDVSRKAVQISKLKGFSVSLSPLEQYAGYGQFDVITAWDVIEHVDNPKEFLERCKCLLKSDGVLLLSTPDAGSKAARDKGDEWIGFSTSLEHISFLDQEFLSRAVEDIFHEEPFLYSFSYGDYSTILGCVKISGTCQQDQLVDSCLKESVYPDDAEKNAEMVLLLSMLYVHFDQRLDQAQKMLDLLELVVPNYMTVIVRSLLLLKQGRYYDAACLLRSTPTARLNNPLVADALTDALWRETSRLMTYLETTCKSAADSALENKRISDEMQRLVEENERIKMEIKQNESYISSFKYELKTRDMEIARLSEVVKQRESSLSWRLSQIYGKYISYNSIPTRLLRTIFDNTILVSKSQKCTTIEKSINIESISAATVPPATLFNPYKRLKMIKRIKVTVIDNDYSDKLNDINIKFSLIIPVKNEEGSLRELLKNIEDQTLKPDEVIFVDGGSTDDTLKILEYYQKNSQITYEVTVVKPDGGSLAAQRNDGIKTARNDILVLTDAGIIPPNYCINLVGVIAERPTIDMVCGIFYQTMKDYWNDQFIWHWETTNYDEFLPSARSMLIKKQLALEIGGFPEFLDFTGEDTLFDLTYRKNSKEWVINRSAFVYWDVVDGDREKARKKGLSYGKGDGENGIGDFRFYEMLVAKLKNNNISIDEPVPAALFNGYLEGRKNRIANLVKKNMIKGNVLILSGVPFTDSGGGQRGTQLALEFMKKGYKVTFCNVYTSFEQEREVYLDIEYPLLELYYLPDFFLDDYIERHNSLLDKTIVLLEFPHPDFIPIINRLKSIEPEIKIVYDCIDNWDSNLGWVWYSKEKELEISSLADVLTASAGTLVSKLKGMIEKEVVLIPNAVNTRLFDASRRYDRPIDLPNNDRQIITYIGAMWGEWFDWELLKELANTVNNADFILIGNIPETSMYYQELRTTKNVFFLGIKNQFDLPAYLYYSDICIIPFKYDEDIIKYTNPLKVYEYLAMRKPVVATYMDELKEVPYVFLSNGYDNFLANLMRALASTLTPESLDIFVYNNSWNKRVDDLINAIFKS